MLSLCLGMLDDEDERAAFADFYARHKGKCLAVALAITRNKAWAEDAIQDAFLKMIQHKDKYFSNSGKRTGSLIVLMVKSSAIDILRREKRLDHALLDDYETFIPNEEPDALRIAEGKETMVRLQYHVSQLDEMSQTLFEMKYMRGQSDGEIADAIGLKKNTVAVRLHRLTKGLYETMRKEGYIDDLEQTVRRGV